MVKKLWIEVISLNTVIFLYNLVIIVFITLIHIIVHSSRYGGKRASLQSVE